jgi:hypothetical protein
MPTAEPPTPSLLSISLRVKPMFILISSQLSSDISLTHVMHEYKHWLNFDNIELLHPLRALKHKGGGVSAAAPATHVTGPYLSRMNVPP